MPVVDGWVCLVLSMQADDHLSYSTGPIQSVFSQA